MGSLVRSLIGSGLKIFFFAFTRIIIVEISDTLALDAVIVVALAAVVLTEMVPQTDRISNSQLLLMKGEQMKIVALRQTPLYLNELEENQYSIAVNIRFKV